MADMAVNSLAVGLLIIFYSLNEVFANDMDDIDFGAKHGAMAKILRAMVNQSDADSLNLPANATSIRENITDTFSCENRTYGYYADVDNDCQIFHVCLPSQTPSGRNITYRWSFICPAETIFNQEVMVCTRSRDSIDCDQSPMFYDRNLDIGKLSNDTTKDQAANLTQAEPNKKEVENIETNTHKKKVFPKRQNLIVETLLQEVVKEFNQQTEGKLHLIKEDEEFNNQQPMIIDVFSEMEVKEPIMDNGNEEVTADERIIGERSIKRRSRNLKKRGSLKFKADNTH